MELLLEAPALRHPSVVCAAPDGRIFVAEDPMDITMAADAQQGRILCRHPDGRLTVFAEGLHAVFGLQYLEGRLYALHNPKFSVFEDGGDTAAGRRDIIEQTNPNPWALDWNDHIPANFKLGLDGRFYMAVGDKGLYQCRGSDGGVVNLRGGGILRLRPDGSQLEIFSTGVRNILDVAMNSEDEIFTYDNTDEHQWMGRLTHMVEGGYYGYPFEFIPRQPHTLWMMHDFGAGAACGVLAATEDALPAEYRDNLFLSDFGKRQIIRVVVERDGAGFRVARHEELFRDPPADFRPVGIAWSEDGGSMLICDWQHRDVKVAEANVGRLWRMKWNGPSPAKAKPEWLTALAMGRPVQVGDPELLAALGHPAKMARLTAQRELSRRLAREREPAQSALAQSLLSLLERGEMGEFGKLHAFWSLAEGAPGGAWLLDGKNWEPALLRQALRAASPRHLSAAGRVEELLGHGDPTVRFQAAAAWGRMRVAQTLPLMGRLEAEEDLVARHGLVRALERAGRAHPAIWPRIVAGLAHESPKVREGASFALRHAHDLGVARALGGLALNEGAAFESRRLAANSLALIFHQEPEWKGEWWAYHPAKSPPPARTRAWEGTSEARRSFLELMGSPRAELRELAAVALGEAPDADALAALRRAASEETSVPARVAALRGLAGARDAETGPLVASLLGQAGRLDKELARAAIGAAPSFGGENLTRAVAALVDPSGEGLEAGTRLEAIEALGRMEAAVAAPSLRRAIASPSAAERKAAVRALGQLRHRDSLPALLRARQSAELEREALLALCRIPDLRAAEAYLGGLSSQDPALREACRAALAPIRKESLALFQKTSESLPGVAIEELRRLFADDPETLAQPWLSPKAASTPEAYGAFALANKGDAPRGRSIFLDEAGVACARCHKVGGQGGILGPDLTLAGAQFSRAQLVESILHPSRAIREGYQQTIVETTDDESVAGALKGETADGITLVDTSGHTVFIPRARVASRRTSDLSLMPEGLHAGLTPEAFTDLIEYLTTLKAP